MMHDLGNLKPHQLLFILRFILSFISVIPVQIHHSQGGGGAILGDPGTSSYPNELLRGGASNIESPMPYVG